MAVLTQAELQKIAQGSGYTGPAITSTGLPTTSGTTTTATPTSAYLNPTQYAGVQQAQQTVSAPSPITIDTLSGTATPINPVLPNTSIPYDISKLDTKIVEPVKLTPAEQQAQDLINITMGLNTEEAGKAAFTAEQNKAQDVSGITAASNDLVALIKGLQNQSKDLQNQAEYTVPNQMQVDAQGRGITAAGLAPHTADELRKIQIKQGAIASQALTYSAAFDAIQGKLANAQQKVKDAVVEKFGPIEAHITANMDNLKLIMSSPQFSKEQVAEAEAKLKVKQAEADQLAQTKTNQAEIWNLTTVAASNGQNFVPSQQYPTLALALQAIQGAPTKEVALDIASATGLISGATGSTTTAPKIYGNATTGYLTYDASTNTMVPIPKSQVTVDANGNPTLNTSTSYQAGMLTQLLQSQGKTADDATLKSLWSQYGNGGTYTNDTAHNSIIYNAMTGGKTTTPTSTYKFTTTQLNTGSATAALSLDAFKALPGEVQNFYINSKPLVTAFNEALTALKDGSGTLDQIKTNINAMALPDAVKQYLIKQATAAAPVPKTTTTSTFKWYNPMTWF